MLNHLENQYIERTIEARKMFFNLEGVGMQGKNDKISAVSDYLIRQEKYFQAEAEKVARDRNIAREALGKKE